MLRHHHVALQQKLLTIENAILSIEDSTTLSYSTHPCTKNLGRVGTHKNSGYGVIVHSSIMVNAATKQTLGVAHQSFFHHEESHLTKSQKKNRPFQEKESYRWVEHLERTHALNPNTIHICDREGDIYEFLLRADELKASYVVRQAQDRLIEKDETCSDDDIPSKISEALGKAISLGTYTSKIEDEDIELTIKAARVTLSSPKRTKIQQQEYDYKPIDVNLVQVKGVTKAGKEISWNLLSNLSIDGFDLCKMIVEYYILRWLIEIFHKTLKTGFGIEKSCLEEAGNLQKLITLTSIEATFVQSILYAARQTEASIPVDSFFTNKEFEALKLLMNKKIEKPTLLEIVCYIAKYGGFNKTKRYPYPGVLTFFQGWLLIKQQIHGVLKTWETLGTLSEDR